MKKIKESNPLFRSLLLTGLMFICFFVTHPLSAEIPTTQRDALIALYNSTDGDNWRNNINWKKPDGTFNDPGTESTWYGVTVSRDNVVVLFMGDNLLKGTLPDDLAALTGLTAFLMERNELSGPFPAFLTQLRQLQELHLEENRLSGPLPADIGNLVNLYDVSFHGNMFSGEIPAGITALTNLQNFFIDFNALYSTDPLVRTFLNEKSMEWERLQTVLPGAIRASAVNETTIQLEWTPIIYTQDQGRYYVAMSTVPGGPYTDVGFTANKSLSTFPVLNLTPGTQYYFQVRTVTAPHPYNPNTVTSELSREIPAVILPQYTLNATSSPTGAPLGVSPADITGSNGGNAPFTRTYHQGGTVNLTASATFNGGNFLHWDVDGVISKTNAVTVSMTNNRNAEAVYGVPAAVTVTAPNGGEVWALGATHTITWESSGPIPAVKIELMTNDSGYWQMVAEAIPNTGSYSWTPQYPVSPHCRIRVSGTDDAPEDTSDAPFVLAGTPLPAAERDALIAFYNAANGDNWTSNYNWKNASGAFNMPGTESSWRGVTVANGHVTALSLTSNNLTGTLPSQLTALTGLTKLELYNNAFNGPIPAVVSQLPALQHLDLAWNQFTGPVPPELAGLGNLRHLRLFSNRLTGTIPPQLGTLPLLESLYLGDNQLEGTIPPQLGDISTLRLLNLSKNGLSGAIPAELGNLTGLYYLSLRDNQLEGAIPQEFTALTGVDRLFLDGNRFSGPFPVHLCGLTRLYLLRLDRNQFAGPIPSEIGNLVNLTTLYLKGNQLSGPIPQTVVNLTKLTIDTDLGYNMLYTDDATVRNFLNGKDADWAATQTVPPDGLSAQAADAVSVDLTWTPIAYVGDGGGYAVYYGTQSGGPYTLHGTTAGKSVSAYTVDGLQPGTGYYFILRTLTPAHAGNANALASRDSGEAEAETQAAADPLRVTAPNGGETWMAGETRVITWTGAGAAASVDIAYSSAGNGGTFIPIVDGAVNTGSYSWTVPDNDSAQCVIRISQSGGGLSDLSDAPFAVLPAPALTVTAPNGGETVSTGDTVAITWNYESLSGTVAIHLFRGDTELSTVGSADVAAGAYGWTVPMDLLPGVDYRIRISLEGISDFSDSYFTLGIDDCRPDFNGDGQADILWRNLKTGKNAIWHMSNDTRLGIAFPPVSTNRHWRIGATADFNRDGKPDILWYNVANGKTAVWHMDNDTRLGIALPPEVTNPDWHIGGAADFNMDGKPDILWRNTATGKNAIWYMDNDTRLGIALPPEVPSPDWTIGGTGDFNGDGKPDILWRNAVTGKNAIWYMDNDTRLDIALPPEVLNLNWVIGAVADFNKDGNPDILWRDTVTGENILWYMNNHQHIGTADIPTANTDWEIVN